MSTQSRSLDKRTLHSLGLARSASLNGLQAGKEAGEMMLVGAWGLEGSLDHILLDSQCPAGLDEDIPTVAQQGQKSLLQQVGVTKPTHALHPSLPLLSLLLLLHDLKGGPVPPHQSVPVHTSQQKPALSCATLFFVNWQAPSRYSQKRDARQGPKQKHFSSAASTKGSRSRTGSTTN